MKHCYTLSAALIGTSIALIQPQIAVALSQQDVEKIAQKITVQIVDVQNPNNSGSGVIIKQAGSTYTVLTAYHVVQSGEQNIIAPDKQSYKIKNSKHLQGLDLAVVEFTSNQKYTTVKIGDSNKATRATKVYVAGFPARTAAISNPDLFLNQGQVNANGAAQRDGYNILYDNDTRKGMSGGAVLNEEGELVAIHGRADEESVGASQTKTITGIGTTINLARKQMMASGVNLDVPRPSVVAAAAPSSDDFYIKAENKSKNYDYRGAIVDYTEAIRLNPNYAEAYNGRGVARSDVNFIADYRGAIVDFNKALEINPNFAYAYSSRSVARGALGDYQGSDEDMQKYLELTQPKF